MASEYQLTGISFQTAVEMGNFLYEQGFETSSEGFVKHCDVDDEIIEVSYVLTRGKCHMTMKPRERRNVRIAIKDLTEVCRMFGETDVQAAGAMYATIGTSLAQRKNLTLNRVEWSFD